MILRIIENGCVGCQLPCIGTACRHYRITRYLCDECEDETTLYDYDGRELCIDCIADTLDKIEGSY